MRLVQSTTRWVWASKETAQKWEKKKSVLFVCCTLVSSCLWREDGEKRGEKKKQSGSISQPRLENSCWEEWEREGRSEEREGFAVDLTHSLSQAVNTTLTDTLTVFCLKKGGQKRWHTHSHRHTNWHKTLKSTFLCVQNSSSHGRQESKMKISVLSCSRSQFTVP